ncbi:MAG: hypothetical protein ABSG94_08890, partial [Brevinematales bacterium]
SPVPLGSGKFLIYAASDVCTNSNDINTLFTAGARYGISSDYEAGIRILSSDLGGVMGDIKMKVIRNDPFTVSFDIGLGGTAQNFPIFNIAFFLDTLIDENVSFYIVARGTYPADNIIDIASMPPSGFQFSPRAGIELFRATRYMLLIEGGVEISWAARVPDFNAAILAGYKL